MSDSDLTAPPTSRLGAHLASIALAALLLASAVWVLAQAASLAADEATGPFRTLGLLLLAAVATGLAGITAGWSTLGLGVAGALLTGAAVAWLVGARDVPGGWATAHTELIEAFAGSGWALLLGLCAAALAVGSHGARQAGRRRGHDEQVHGRGSRRSPATLVPPRSRLVAHALTIALAAITGWLALDQLTPQSSPDDVVPPWAPIPSLRMWATVAALVLLALSVRWSALGALAVGAVFVALTTVTMADLVLGDGPTGTSWLDTLSPALGPAPWTLLVAALFLGGALGAQRARAAGRRLALAEEHSGRR